jgi:hypothetical protein
VTDIVDALRRVGEGECVLDPTIVNRRVLAVLTMLRA